MNSGSTPGTHTRSGGPRSAFVFALLGSLGVALVGLQMVEPVRQAYGLDPIIPSPFQAGAQTALAPSGTQWFDRSAAAHVVVERSIPTRPLGSGTRRAVRLAPSVVQMASVHTLGSPVVSVLPVVAAAPAQPRTTQQSDATRRDDAVPGRAQLATLGKLDDALRRIVDGNPAVPVRVIMQTQPGQHETIAQWLTTSGRQVHRVHSSFDGLTATLSAADVVVLSGDPSIARLSIDAVVTTTGTGAVSFGGYRVLDASGAAGYTSDVVAAIEYATANRDALDIDVMNLSLGHPIYARAADDPLVQAVEKAADAGLLIVWGDRPVSSTRSVRGAGRLAVEDGDAVAYGDRLVWGGRLVRGDPLGIMVNGAGVVEAGN